MMNHKYHLGCQTDYNIWAAAATTRERQTLARFVRNIAMKVSEELVQQIIAFGRQED